MELKESVSVEERGREPTLIYSGYQKIPLTSTSWKEIPKDKRLKWYVTEKIHGSCFCFIYEPVSGQIQYAKRNKMIQEEEYFFGYQAILEELLPKLQQAFLLLLNELKITPKSIMVYGELFGGHYAGFESKFRAIQSGIYYSPNIHFYAFDSSFLTPENQEIYIDFEKSLEIFRQSGLFHAEPLATYPTFEKAIQHKVGFNTTIPRKLGLPEIKDNKAEGIVVRSGKGHYLVKIKIPEFSESKYDDNDYEDQQSDQLDPLIKWKRLAVTHLTANRFNNALSKVGEFEQNQEEIYELFADDILLELNAFHVPGLREWLLEKVREITP